VRDDGVVVSSCFNLDCCYIVLGCWIILVGYICWIIQMDLEFWACKYPKNIGVS